MCSLRIQGRAQVGRAGRPAAVSEARLSYSRTDLPHVVLGKQSWSTRYSVRCQVGRIGLLGIV